FVIFLFSKVLRAPLEEWRYVMLTFLGAFAFWVNHYFQNAPFYGGFFGMLSLYTYGFLICWYFIGVKPQQRGWLWQVGAMLSAIVFTIAFILFENISRWGVNQGISDYWFMLISAFGIVGIILWRGTASSNSKH
ncbi:MAG: hypothetical protein P8R04_07620, partial [Gammaproteobacteria bacterium]|nr:hypothetical protein [Gammaproteobacteria bacterium]